MDSEGKQEPQEGIRKLRVLNNPIRLQAFTFLRAFGAATASEIAEWIGMEEHLLYYHLGQLVKAGFVEVADSRAGVTKPAAIYKPGKRLHMKRPYSKDPELRRAIAKNVAQVLRIAAGEYKAALQAIPGTADKNCSLHRMTTRLNAAEREELRLKINEVAQWVNEHQNEAGECYTVTFVVCNLVSAK